MTGMDKSPQRIAPGVFLVAGPNLTDQRDCLCYLVRGQEARVLIDCGSGPSAEQVLFMAEEAAGGTPTHLLLTHAHIDHAGGAAELKRRTGCEVLIHSGDVATLREGDAERSAATWYGLRLEALEPDRVLEGGETIPLGGDQTLNILHTPGHTPGSISAWCWVEGKKVLFAQDVHGPFSPAFGSDLGLWHRSMNQLLELEADILAEGHYGVYRSAEEVRTYLQEQLKLNQ